MYLMKYGYMDMPRGNGKSAPLLSQDGLRNYIRKFQVYYLVYLVLYLFWKISIVFCQAFGGLRPTGQLDSETVALMKRPRFDNWGKVIIFIEGILLRHRKRRGVGYILFAIFEWISWKPVWFAKFCTTLRQYKEKIVYTNNLRCGVKDVIGKASGSRRKRFALQGE